MAELISAKDLPVSEAANVKLLCVDGEQLKLKSVEGMGGYVLTVPADALVMDDEGTSAIINEDCGPVAELISRGASVWVDLSQTAVAGIVGASWVMAPVMFAAYTGNGLLLGGGFDGMSMQIYCPNCSWKPGNE